MPTHVINQPKRSLLQLLLDTFLYPIIELKNTNMRVCLINSDLESSILIWVILIVSFVGIMVAIIDVIDYR